MTFQLLQGKILNLSIEKIRMVRVLSFKLLLLESLNSVQIKRLEAKFLQRWEKCLDKEEFKQGVNISQNTNKFLSIKKAET